MLERIGGDAAVAAERASGALSVSPPRYDSDLAANEGKRVAMRCQRDPPKAGDPSRHHDKQDKMVVIRCPPEPVDWPQCHEARATGKAIA